jgi:hypothetical protein
MIAMSAENEAYVEGTRLLRELGTLCTEVQNINASDTQCKERALTQLREARQKLREALSTLSGLV